MIQKNTQPALKDNEPNTKVYGDNTGADNTYVWHVNDKVVSGSSPAFILDAMKEKGKKPEISRKGIVFLLHNSLVPTPETVYKNVYALGVGDQLSFNPDKPNDDPVFSCDYPYWSVHCTGKSDPSTKKLLKVLTRSVAKHVQGPSVLMLSSGKDSTSIALAIKEAGVSDQVQAYTYTDAKSGYIEEAEDAAKTAEKLGIRHQKITVPDDPKNVREALIHFFTHASYPSCDPTTIPYVVGLYHEGIRNTQIIDGTRSDMSMGMSPGAPYDKICKYYDMIGGGWTSFGKVRAKVPYHHKAVKFVSTWPEINLYRHGHFRANETRRFFDHDVDTEKFWLKVYKDHAHRPLIDQYSYTNDQYFAGCGIIPKIKMTAESLSCESVLPWADQDFINYYFNLPQAYKYNTKTKTNKVLLRQMLAEYLDYDARKTGKRIFYFNMGQFVSENKEFIRDEILSCSLWNKNIERELNKHLTINEQAPRAGGAIIDWFMISGWVNHCKYL